MKRIFLIAVLCGAHWAAASVYGVVTAAPQNVEMTAKISANSELLISVKVNERVVNCPVSLSNAELGYTTPRNMGYAEMKGANFFALWHGRQCFMKAMDSKEFLERQESTHKFFELVGMTPAAGLESLQKSGVKLSFCFQPGDGYECSKPVGYDDLKDGEIKIYPFSSK